MRALVVEDDPHVGPDVRRALQAIGFVTELVADGEQAWFQGDVEDYDIIVLDLGLPKLDGLSVLRKWRTSNRSMPVMVLSARGDWTEKVEGIEAGADDYLGKPFEMGELVTRVRALVRRSAGRASPVFALGKLSIDQRRMVVTLGGIPLALSRLEFRLINYLAHHPGVAVSAGELAEHLYGMDEPADNNAIEALVMRVRRKLSPKWITTRRGFGYVLVDGGM